MNAGIFGKIGMLIDEDETVNEAVRECFGSGFVDERGRKWPLDFRSARRRAALTPNLYNDIFDYACPSDLNAMKLIDIPAQAKRQDGEFFLIPTTEFAVKHPKGAVAIKDYNNTRVIQINSDVNSKDIMVAELDSLTSASNDGTSWALFGDATGVAADTDNYVKGNGSISYDISAAAGTTAGIQHASINAVDMTDYFGGNSSFFVWAYIGSTTGLTNFILRFGTDASNYYHKTITAQHDGTAFVAGWNLLRFDVSSYSTQGTPTVTNIKYFVIHMTKATTKVSETDYRFDWLTLKRGVIHNIEYYTKYGWQSSAAAYKENSTADDDVIVADFDEYQIVIQKAIEKAACEVREVDTAEKARRDFVNLAKAYMMANPSEAKIMTSEYNAY